MWKRSRAKTRPARNSNGLGVRSWEGKTSSVSGSRKLIRNGTEFCTPTALQQAVIASIGPMTSEILRHESLPVDLEPDRPKMGQLIRAAAEQAPALVRRKRGC